MEEVHMPLGIRARALRAITLTLTLSLSSFALAVDATHSGKTLGLILSGLPAGNSTAYRDLKRAAGEPESEALEMTGAEMWSVPEERIDAFKGMAAARGIGVTDV